MNCLDSCSDSLIFSLVSKLQILTLIYTHGLHTQADPADGGGGGGRQSELHM